MFDVCLSMQLSYKLVTVDLLLQNEHFPLIYCIEKLVFSHDYTRWESCFEPLGLDSKLVSDCYAGGRGKEVSFTPFICYRFH